MDAFLFARPAVDMTKTAEDDEWRLAEYTLAQRMFADLALRFDGNPHHQLAHDLRNRLMPMLTLAQMLKKPEVLDAATLGWAAQSIEKKILELSDLATSLQNKGSQPPGRPADLRGIVMQALDTVRPLLARHGLSLPSRGVWISGRHEPLAHPIALCLLETARHADGLLIDILAESGLAILVIRRQGAIPSGKDWILGEGGLGKEALFQSGPLPGMGLALAKMLVEDCGGELEFHYAGGQPPCQQAIIRLPLARPKMPPDGFTTA